jgi:hypothetical protein
LIYFKNANVDVLNVLWAYGQWKNLYEEQIPNVRMRHVEGLPSEDEILEDKPHYYYY